MAQIGTVKVGIKVIPVDGGLHIVMIKLPGREWEPLALTDEEEP